MPNRITAVLHLLLLSVAISANAQTTVSTTFEPPTFVLGDVNGQNGWGHLSNSPTKGIIEPVPAGSPAQFGTQSLAIRTRNVDFFGVSNHLYSSLISPAAGETGSTAEGMVMPDPQSHFAATVWVHTPPAPVISTRADGRFAELNPSTKGPNVDHPANRYAQVRLLNTTNTSGGLVRADMGWYRASGFTVAPVATMNWNSWYRFEYLIHLVDGTDGAEPNDRFTLTIFDLAGTQIGTACGSTFEIGYKSGTFGGGTTPRAINGFDFWSVSGPNDRLAAHIDNFTMSTFDATPLGVAVSGGGNVCPGGTLLLSAATTGTVPVTSYAWRNAANEVVATTPTFNAGVGAYTVTVTDQLCASVTSSQVTVGVFLPLQLSVDGPAIVTMNQLATLAARITGGSGRIASFQWRDAASTIISTTQTFAARPGVYTLTVTDDCGSTASQLFVVTAAAETDVPTMSEWGLLLMLAAMALVALVQLR